jgi:hypothetical protein
MDGVLSFTTSEPEAILPLPPSMDVTGVKVVLFFVPDVAPVTVTLNAQLLLAASNPPANAIDLVVAIVVRVPPHSVVDESIMERPAGNISIKPMPDSGVDRFGLVMVKVNVEVSPVKIDVGEKDLAIAGGAITVRESVA